MRLIILRIDLRRGAQVLPGFLTFALAEQGHGQFVAREPNNPVNRALSTWKELTAPHKIERAGIPATGV